MSASRESSDALLKRLEWTVIRKLDGLLQGDYRTLFRGFGLDLADLREYQPYDDVRHIDWNVTARTRIPHVRVYNEDREVTAWFLLDLSPSVDFGSGAVSKRDILAEFTAVISRLLTRQGNKVGVILYDGVDDFVIPPRTGRRHVLHVLDRIYRHPRRTRAPNTDLGAFVRRSLSTIRRRSLIFVVSDYISEPGWERSLALLNQRHEGIAIRLVDPLDTALPDIGPLVFQDAESGEQVSVDTNDGGFRRRFAASAEASGVALIEALGEAGMDVLELGTGDDLVDAIMRFTQMRKPRGRLSGPGTPARFPTESAVVIPLRPATAKPAGDLP